MYFKFSENVMVKLGCLLSFHAMPLFINYSFSACLGMVSDGMQFGWPSPAVPILMSNETYIYVTKEQCGWITNWYILGNIFGLFLSITLFKKISRKLALSLASLPVLLGWCGLLVANKPSALYLARFIGKVINYTRQGVTKSRRVHI